MEVVLKCNRCLYSDCHPLGIYIDEQGVCSGCRVHEEKDRIDWSLRFEEILHLVAPYRSKQANYDCIVPVDGSPESFYILHIVKNRLKMNPLLVSYNRLYNTPMGIRNLANLRMTFDCDFIQQNVNPFHVKEIVRVTTSHLGSIHWHVNAGQQSFATQTAVRFGIPLIFWGAHQGLEQTGMYSHLDNVEMSRRYWEDHDLMGVTSQALAGGVGHLGEEHLHQYFYPDDSALNRVGVRGIYLGNYFRWDPKLQNEMMIDTYKVRTRVFARTFDYYEYGHDAFYMGPHDILKFFKHGYSKVLDQACREIRHGRMSRITAKEIVNLYQRNGSPSVKLFAKWLDTSLEAIEFVLNLHRAPTHFSRDENFLWPPLSSADSLAETVMDLRYRLTERDPEDLDCLVIGKGW